MLRICREQVLRTMFTLCMLTVALTNVDGADSWRAWTVTDNAGTTKLVVEGIYANGGPGTVVHVSPADPQGTNHQILLLDVNTSLLPGVWPAIVLPVPAAYHQSPYKKGTYTSVQLRYPDGNSITIDKIYDAGKAPKAGEPLTGGAIEFEGESNEGSLPKALNAALKKLDKARSDAGADILANWKIVEVSGQQGGIAGLTTVKVKISATGIPD